MNYMKRILIIRSANFNVMNNLIMGINDRFGNEEVNIYCLTNKIGFEDLKSKYENIRFLIYNHEIFNYKFLKQDKELLENIHEYKYDELYIPSSYNNFQELYNVLEIGSKIKSKKYILFSCNSQMKEVKLKYYSVLISKIISSLDKNLIKIMLVFTEKFYCIIRKYYGKRISKKIVKKDTRIDIGDKFLRNIILYNNRFDYYKAYIELAKVNGYLVTSLIDYVNNYKESNKKVLILRHDVDSVTNNTKEMFKIECDNKVLSTYYFRWLTFNKELISSMNKYNFEVGLHYETLAQYCIKNNISIVDQDKIDKCRNILKQDILKFNRECGIRIQSVANHGHPYNVKLKVSNNILLEDIDYSYFGIKLEAYDKKLYENCISNHIMDSDIMNNYGFSYENNPIKSIKTGDRVIVFLAHPEHWKYSINDRVKMYLDYKNGNYTRKTNRKFIRILKDGLV